MSLRTENPAVTIAKRTATGIFIGDGLFVGGGLLLGKLISSPWGLDTTTTIVFSAISGILGASHGLAYGIAETKFLRQNRKAARAHARRKNRN